MARCPDCFVPMTRVEEDGLKMATCPQCFGTWVSGLVLLRRMRMDVETQADVLAGGSLEDLIEMAMATNSKKELRCPSCTKPMGKDKVHPLIPVTIDRCGPCRQVWLDAGELRLIRALYKEMVTTDDPEIRRKLEKIAGAKFAEAEWASRRQAAWERQSSGSSSWDLGGGWFDLPGF